MAIGGELGYRLLRWIKPGSKFEDRGEPRLSYVPKVRRIVGENGWESLRDKTILDFGCGIGIGCVEMAKQGATRVIGLDIRPEVLEVARKSAEDAGVSNVCTFANALESRVDVIMAIDAFEHFGDPAGILEIMDRSLKDDGMVLISFGPTWYHPRGGHLFSVFPWSHLLFTEKAQIRWRSDFKSDGATRFSEVAGGLNMMTIKRFINLIEASPFRIEMLRTVPIKPLAWAHNRLTREFTTSVIECKLVKQQNGAAVAV